MRSFRVLALLLSCHALYGCELIADFDRDKLDAGATSKDAGKMPLEPDAGPDDMNDLDAG
ncbi:MAG TPA: hypothetical protein VFN67_42340 [Polyangiales bacterium]|nr:hypothetical protein [Polyangiales bacterium]